jgi:ribosome-associated toxin RatA of RatAB toxin-antitoxin module
MKNAEIGRMAAQLAFDTLAFVKRLSAAGMETRQAEALAEALVDNAFDTLATKGDIKDLRTEIKEVELRLSAELGKLEIRLSNSLTARMAAMIGGSSALVVGVLGALRILS